MMRLAQTGPRRTATLTDSEETAISLRRSLAASRIIHTAAAAIILPLGHGLMAEPWET
jgi:hypothetical protein